jgi:DNA polymerase III gamma/tau subunit
MIKTTIITTIENLYNMIKKPSEQTTQLYKTTIEQITNMPDPRPLLQLSIRTTNDQQPEQFLQQLLTQILQTIKAEEKPPVASATETKPETTPPATSTPEVTTKPEETVAQPSVATAEKPETAQTEAKAEPQVAPATIATTTQTAEEQTLKTEEEISELTEKAKGEVTKMTQAPPQESKMTQEASTKETKQETPPKEQEKERTAKEKPEKKREGKPKKKKKEAETTQAETQKITQPPPETQPPSPTVQEHEKIRTAILDIAKELTQKASPTKEDIINTLQNKQYIVIKGDVILITPDFLYNIIQRMHSDTKTLIQTFNMQKTAIRMGNNLIAAYKISRNTFEQLIT